MAEWLRRWTANPLCSARVGSNPILVDIIFRSFYQFRMILKNNLFSNMSEVSAFFYRFTLIHHAIFSLLICSYKNKNDMPICYIFPAYKAI